MNEAFVYCWTDHKTNKLYVGSHKGSIDDGYICSSKIMNEEFKCRPNDFTRQIIATGKYEEILKLEVKILVSIDAKNSPSFYNMQNGDGKFYNKGHSALTKHKIANAHTGKKYSDERKQQMSAERKLRCRTPEFREMCRQRQLGKKLTPETKLKMSLSAKGKPKSKEHIAAVKAANKKTRENNA